MDLFSIRCTTCGQRLVVRSRSAVGQIMACPRCQSMVDVQPPPGWRPPVEPTAGESSAPPATAPTPLPPPVQKTRVDPAKDAADFDDAARMLHDASDPPTEPPVVGQKRPETPRDPDVADVPMVPTDDWTSDAARKWRRYALGGVGGIAGIVLVSLAIGAVVSRSGNDTRATADNPPPPAAEQDPPADSSTGNDDDIEDGSDDPSRDSSTEDTTHRADEADDHAPPVEAPSEDRDARTPEADETTTVDSEASNIDDDDTPDEAVSPPSDGHPDDSDDESTDEAIRPSPGVVGPPDLVATPETPASDGVSEDDLPDALGRFGPLLENDRFDESSEADPSDEEDDARPVESHPRPPPLAIDVDERLTDEVAEIQVPGVPLHDFVAFSSRFSTIPIAIDPDGLAWANRSADSKVTVHETRTTLGDFLAAALGPMRLQFVANKDHLVITRFSNHHQGTRRIEHGIADLAKDTGEAEQLRQWITRHVAPSSWLAIDGTNSILVEGDKLVVNHGEAVQLRILRFLDKLRVARGIAPSSRLPTEMFSLPTRRARAQALLDTKITLNFGRPTKLTTILDRLQADTGAALLVDWGSTLPIGWNLESETTLVSDQEPLSDALTQMLRPMQLGYRAFDEKTLQIMAAQDLATRAELEIYPLAGRLPSGDSPDELLRTVKERILASRGPEDQRPLPIDYDRRSNSLLATIPQPEQGLLESLLPPK